MRFNVNQALKNLAGEELQTQVFKGDKIETVPLTLRSAVIDALLANHGDQPSGQEKFERYQLAQKIHGADVVDLQPEEIVKIKEVVGKHYLPIVVGRVFEAMDRPLTTENAAI